MIKLGRFYIGGMTSWSINTYTLMSVRNGLIGWPALVNSTVKLHYGFILYGIEAICPG